MFKKRIRLNTSKLSVVLYGALIGFLTGIVVSVFRWTIEKLLQFVQALYVDISHGNITLGAYASFMEWFLEPFPVK